MARKSVNFNVSDETHNKIKQIFPDVVGTEDNLKQLIQGYEYYQQHKDDPQNTDELDALRTQVSQLTMQLSDKTDELNAMSEQIRDLNSNTASRESELKEQIQTLEEQNMSLASVISERDAVIGDLEARQPTWAQIRTSLQPFTARLIEETAKRLSERYGKQVAPMSILTDMFLRYTIERWNEWFYKFCFNDREILAIAQEINPDIKSIDQVKKAVCK